MLRINKTRIDFFRRFLRFLRPQWKRGVGAGIFTGVTVLLQLPFPLLTMYIIDSVLPRKDASALNWVVLGLIGFVLMKVTTEFLNGYLLSLFRERALFDMQLRLFEHIQRLSLSFFHKQKTGYLMSRIRRDVIQLQGLLAGTLLSFLRNSITLVVGTALIFTLHWRLALASILVLPFFVYAVSHFSLRIREKSKQVQEKAGLADGVLQESLSAIHIVKSFLMEKHEALRMMRTLRDSLGENIRLFALNNFSSAVVGLIGAVGPIVVLWYGGHEIMAGNLTVGKWFAFNSFLAYLFVPCQSLVNLNATVQGALGSLERVFALMDLKPEISQSLRPKKLQRIRGEIVFEKVSFSYDGMKPVLEKVNLTVRPGERIALAGRSGAGKSSLVNLIPRFHDPLEGAILIDGTHIREVTLRSLRAHIGIVPQETFLFSGTIRENIKYGKWDATDNEVVEAAKMANADKFTEKLPKNYDTEVGERGVKLSGGERQRIAIARVVLKNPPILIFDEATSELDSESERLIQEALELLMKDRTVFIIAHRLSTIRKADRIVVLDNGRIVEEGRHEGLYARNGVYRKLYDDQYGKEEVSQILEPDMEPGHELIEVAR